MEKSKYKYNIIYDGIIWSDNDDDLRTFQVIVTDLNTQKEYGLCPFFRISQFEKLKYLLDSGILTFNEEFSRNAKYDQNIMKLESELHDLRCDWKDSIQIINAQDALIANLKAKLSFEEKLKCSQNKK